MDVEEIDYDVISPKLSWPRRFTYSIGHVLNDLCASMWFTYLLVFFQSVALFSTSEAGYLLLIGQITDAICTPLVGYAMDRMDGCCGYTKRKSWHLLGTVCCIFSFPFFFMECLFCSGVPSSGTKFGYYIPFILLSQFGWACTQVSHLSLIPDLTPCKNERVLLNSMRYAFTVLSNLTVYSLTWFVLTTGGTSTETSPNGSDYTTNYGNATFLLNSSVENPTVDNLVPISSKGVTPDDAPQFRTLILSVVGGGILFSILFHAGTKEPKDVEVVNKDHKIINKSRMTWTCWLKEGQFYQIALLYMFTRLAVNVAQVYIPMYLTYSLELPKQYIAIIPLVLYIGGFLTTFLMRCVNKRVGKKITYAGGAVLMLGAALWMYFLRQENHYLIFGPATLLGIGCSVLLITSLSIVADLIGRHTCSGAFVYGAMSFTDKLSNGVVILLIQDLHPCKLITCAEGALYYRNIMLYIPAGAALCGIIVILSLIPFTIGKLKADQEFELEADNLETFLSVHSLSIHSLGSNALLKVKTIANGTPNGTSS